MTHPCIPHLTSQAAWKRMLLLGRGHGNELKCRNQTRYRVN